MAQSVRIISGKWRSLRVNFPEIPGLRPTQDRIRETLFNWLAPVISETKCLDLFAGSGVLGFEALSRGAQFACFVERDPKALAALRLNAEKFSLTSQQYAVISGQVPKRLPPLPPRPLILFF